jgi:hypothetical protein
MGKTIQAHPVRSIVRGGCIRVPEGFADDLRVISADINSDDGDAV